MNMHRNPLKSVSCSKSEPRYEMLLKTELKRLHFFLKLSKEILSTSEGREIPGHPHAGPLKITAEANHGLGHHLSKDNRLPSRWGRGSVLKLLVSLKPWSHTQQKLLIF